MFFTCTYCGKRFSHQKNHEKHFCEEMKKSLLMKTKTGKVALAEYQKWRKICGHRVNDERTFLRSKYFKSFLNFVEYSKEKMIPDRVGFMKLMQQKQILPSYWSNDLYHNAYLESFDKLYSPLKQVELSYNYLNSLSQSIGCNVDAVVNNLQTIDLIRLITARKLSPWFLLFHSTFRDLVRFRLEPEEKILLESVINSKIWKEKFKNSPEDVKKIKELINYLKL